MRLTRRQRQILWLMRTFDGPTYFSGGTRKFYWHELDHGHPGALIVQAYQDPEMWLEHRGLIVQTPMNVPGRWYRLTEQGSAIAGKLKVCPL